MVTASGGRGRALALLVGVVCVAGCSPTQEEPAATAGGVGTHAAPLSEAGPALVLQHALGSTTPLADGRVLVAGGMHEASSTSLAEIYDPATGTFATRVTMPDTMSGHRAVRLTNGRVLLAGGQISAVNVARALLFDPATNTFSRTGSLATARVEHTLTALADGRALACGGIGNNTRLSSCELFNPATGTWSAAAPLPSARNEHAATLLPDGRVLVSGGSNYGAVPTHVYTPSTNSWSASFPATPRARHVAALLPGGRVLVAGGVTPNTATPVSTAQVWEPATSSWRTVPDMAGARTNASTILDPTDATGGRVLVFGGSSASAAALAVEAFDVATDAWTSPGALLQARSLPGLAPLPGQRVLVVGSRSEAPVAATTELFSQGPCTPTTCAAQGKTCGSIPDGCGGTLACGTCGAGQQCSASNVCVATTTAVYDAARRAPTCNTAGAACDSVDLLVGRGPLGPERNAPNTVNGSCADGSSGTFHSDESLDRLKVTTVDGTALAPGKQVRVEATVWNFGGDTLDLYVAANASAPAWTLVGSQPGGSTRGTVTLTSTLTLPAGTAGFQAIRGVFRYGGSAGSCVSGGYNDHDDLVFAVAAPPTSSSVVLVSPSAGARLSGTVTLAANASSPQGISRVEFLRSGTVLGSDATAPYELAWDTTTTANGSHTLTARAWTTDGTSLETGPRQVEVANDLVGPTVAIDEPVGTGFYSGNILITARLEDTSGVERVEVVLDGTLVHAESLVAQTYWLYQMYRDTTSLADGPHTLVVRARDTQGNWGASAPRVFTTDNTRPVGSIRSPAAGAIVNTSAQVVVDGADANGIVQVQLYVDGQLYRAESNAAGLAMPVSIPWNVLDHGPGTHTLTARLADRASLVTFTAPVTVEAVVDTAPPTVALTAPADGALLSGTVTLTADATDDSRVTGVSFYRDGVLLGTDAAAPYALAWDTLGVANGEVTLSAVAVDAVGRTATTAGVTVRVRNDRAPPAASVVTPTQDSLHTGPVAVRVAATDDLGLARLEVRIDGALVHAADLDGQLAAEAAFTWTPSGAQDGAHTLVVRALDAAGKAADSAPRAFRTDVTAPQPVITTPESDTTVTEGVYVGAQAAGGDTSVARAVLLVDGQQVSESVNAMLPTGFYWDVASVSDGVHVLVVRFTDAAGLTGESAPVTVTLQRDTVAPTVAITSPAHGATVSGPVQVTLAVSDNQPGPLMIELRVNGTVVGGATSPDVPVFWDTTALPDGAYQLEATARDRNGNLGRSALVDVLVSNTPVGGVEAQAVRDATLQAPGCHDAALAACDSGTLLVGRGQMTYGAEAGAPNTLGGSCADDSSGAYQSDESLERLRVATEDGSAMAPGKEVRITADVWAWGDGSADSLDLYYAEDAKAPTWVFLRTLKPTAGGASTLSTTYTLPAGAGLHAVRGVFRYDGMQAVCASAGYTDHDDLFFQVQAPGAP